MEKVLLEVSEYSWICPECKEHNYSSVYDIEFEDGGGHVKCDTCQVEYITNFEG